MGVIGLNKIAIYNIQFFQQVLHIHYDVGSPSTTSAIIITMGISIAVLVILLAISIIVHVMMMIWYKHSKRSTCNTMSDAPIPSTQVCKIKLNVVSFIVGQ